MNDDEVRALRKEIGGIYDRLTRIETMLSERCEGRADRLDDHERRIEKLEHGQAKLIGAAVALSAVINWVLKGMGVE